MNRAPTRKMTLVEWLNYTLKKDPQSRRQLVQSLCADWVYVKIANWTEKQWLDVDNAITEIANEIGAEKFSEQTEATREATVRMAAVWVSLRRGNAAITHKDAAMQHLMEREDTEGSDQKIGAKLFAIQNEMFEKES